MKITSLLIVLLTLISPLISMADKTVSDAIKACLKTRQKAFKSEDIDLLLSTVHPKYPDLEDTKNTKMLFEDYDIEFNLVSYSFIGRDGEYATVRVKESMVTTGSTSTRGTMSFTNNLETIQVYRQNMDNWLLWGQIQLDPNYEIKVEPVI